MTQPLVSTPVIEVRSLEKSYGSIRAVRGLNLEVGRGQIYGFLGPNGAGKTTTIRMLLGLIRPTGGAVKLFGESLVERRRSLLRKVGAIVEMPSAYAHLTGWENLEVTRRMLRAPRGNIAAALKLVGLEDAAHRAVRGYSLGMRGRLSLAAALLGDPELLILDEPTNGLDPAGIREIRDLIRTFPARGITVLVSSHLLSEVEQMATHVGIVTEGQMRFSGRLEDLQARSTSRIVLEVDRPGQALKLIQTVHPNAELNGESLEVPIPFSQAASLNRLLIEAGYSVSRLEPLTQSLEELFLTLTKPQEENR